jgi:hypothetical protein
MAFNGSGTYNLPSGNPVVTGTTISTTWANTTLSDIASALTNCVTRDGQSPATANIPLGNYKLTGVGSPAATGDALVWGSNATISALTLTTALTVANGGTGAATLTGLVKGNGTSAFTAATSGTDYAPATSGTGILKGDGSGGFSTATSGTDYVIPSGTVALATNCTNAIGYSQTWQNVAGSRSLSTTYTNSTGKPIEILVNCLVSTTSVSLSLNGTFAGEISCATASVGFVSAVIPDGTTYRLSGSGSIFAWWELR